MTWLKNKLARIWSRILSIPKDMGIGYALMRKEAKRHDMHALGPPLGFFMTPFNAWCIYVPKFFRYAIRWWVSRAFRKPLETVEPVKFRALLIFSPIVAWGVGMGMAWAVAVVGHEIGHALAYDSCRWDWWWLVGASANIVISFTIWGWVYHAAITLINEAWASILAYKNGYVHSWVGVLGLSLAYSTYLWWGWNVLLDVMNGLNPVITGSI